MPDETTPQPDPEEERAEDQPTEAAETQPEPEGVSVPEMLADIDEETLRELHAQLEEARLAAREAQDVERVRAVLADQQRIFDEITRRRAEAEQRDAELAEIDALELPSLPEPVPTLAGAGASAAQLAAARGGQEPVAQDPPPPAPARPRVALLAAAGTQVVPAGEEINFAQLGQAIDRAKRGREGQTILASVPGFEEAPDSMGGIMPLSERNGATLNDELIQLAVEDWWNRTRGLEPSRMASAMLGAICQPYDIIRDIPDAFVTSTPVADVFPTRPAGRGGFQFTPSGVLADVTGGVNLWSEAQQAAVDPNNAATWKQCIDYNCPPIQTAVLEAIYACVRFDITLEMSNPERVRNLNNALGALRARIHEGRLLQRIDQLSSGYRFDGDYGALPAVIEAVNTLVAQLTFTDRQSDANYTLIIPPGVVEILTIDRANRAYGVEMEASDVMTYLRGNLVDGVSVVETMDASLGGEPGIPFGPLHPVGNQASMGAMNYISGAFYRLRLVDPAAAIYASTGEINAGTMRDSTLIRMNKTAYFTEEFFFLAKHGPQPWATIDLQLCADGSRAGLIAPNGCTTS